MLVSKAQGGAKMIKANNFLIIGGDSRQLYMADYLEKSGKKISVYGLPEKERKCTENLKSAIAQCDAVVFPLPLTKDNKYPFTIVPIKESLDDIIAKITDKQLVFAGMADKGFEAKIKKKGVRMFDYFKREDVTVMNTIPTLQGILKVIIDNIDFTLHSSSCAIFGYGRVAKVTADALSSLGADVTICVRKGSDISLAMINGLKGCLISESYKYADRFDIIINTVPSTVINRRFLENAKPDCLIIDVASAPFGTDFAAANELGINAIQCSSLPGKVAPKTAGKIIADGIINILKEEGYE